MDLKLLFASNLRSDSLILLKFSPSLGIVPSPSSLRDILKHEFVAYIWTLTSVALLSALSSRNSPKTFDISSLGISTCSLFDFEISISTFPEGDERLTYYSNNTQWKILKGTNLLYKTNGNVQKKYYHLYMKYKKKYLKLRDMTLNKIE